MYMKEKADEANRYFSKWVDAYRTAFPSDHVGIVKEFFHLGRILWENDQKQTGRICFNRAKALAKDIAEDQQSPYFREILQFLQEVEPERDMRQ
jgi:hypothetical protein